MKTANMHEAKSQLSKLVDAALSGEEVVIARRGKHLVRLQVIQDEPVHRKVGTLPHLASSLPDDFNDSFEDWNESLV